MRQLRFWPLYPFGNEGSQSHWNEGKDGQSLFLDCHVEEGVAFHQTWFPNSHRAALGLDLLKVLWFFKVPRRNWKGTSCFSSVRCVLPRDRVYPLRTEIASCFRFTLLCLVQVHIAIWGRLIKFSVSVQLVVHRQDVLKTSHSRFCGVKESFDKVAALLNNCFKTGKK